MSFLKSKPRNSVSLTVDCYVRFKKEKRSSVEKVLRGDFSSSEASGQTSSERRGIHFFHRCDNNRCFQPGFTARCSASEGSSVKAGAAAAFFLPWELALLSWDGGRRWTVGEVLLKSLIKHFSSLASQYWWWIGMKSTWIDRMEIDQTITLVPFIATIHRSQLIGLNLGLFLYSTLNNLLYPGGVLVSIYGNLLSCISWLLCQCL